MKRIIAVILFLTLLTARVWAQVGTVSNSNDGHSNVMTFYVNDELRSNVRIGTRIPFDHDNNTTVTIKGYNDGSYAVINLQMGWQDTRSEITSSGASNAGGILPGITLVNDHDGYVSILLDFVGRFTRFEVTALANGLGEDPSWYTGWSVYDNEERGGYDTRYDVECYNQFANLGANNVNASSVYASTVGTSNLNVYGNINITNGAIYSNYNGWKPYGFLFAQHSNFLTQNAYYDGHWKSFNGGAGTDYSRAVFLSTGAAEGKAFNVVVNNGTITAPNQLLSFTNVFNVDLDGNAALSGKMFIGNITPTNVTNLSSYSLAVNGSALFTKAVVKLYGTWPDYVFTPGYKLKPLSEVEDYIKKYSHLPEVTSASEAEKNGIDLGTTQAQLLKKVEELTLYIIEQDKKSKEQSDKLKSLEEKLNKLLTEKN